ncbi:MAG TPA: Rrf2 family transcriptional regulator [Thermoleophilia bacterium]|nr:Rrf2 family transcriptional regulator [Thermoleophilia bacterium]
MRISSRCEYGLRAMVYLAGHDDGRPVPLPEIAAGENIPAPFLERILARLRESGLVKATRGVSGGYQLARPAGDVAVGEVVTALEGPLSLVGCVPDDGACERAESCASRVVWRRLDSAISGALNSITLDDLTRDGKRAGRVCAEDPSPKREAVSP